MPLLLPALALALGLLIAYSEAFSLSTTLMLLAGLWLLALKWRFISLISFIFGLLYGLLSLIWQVEQSKVDPQWLNVPLAITAIIVEVENTSFYSKLRLRDVVHAGLPTLSGYADVYVYKNRQSLVAGQRIQAKVKFHLPRNAGNPIHFDMQSYAFYQKLMLMGSAKGQVHILAQPIDFLTQIRNRIIADIQQAGAQEAGILSALLLAKCDGIPVAVDDAFAASGATHLLAISGLHVGLVAGWGFALSWWLLTRREKWMVMVPVKDVALLIGLVLAGIYASIAGWPIPAQRAFLMLMAAVLAWWLRHQHHPLNTMLAAMVLMLLFEPAAIVSISLWLSFTATCALLLWASERVGKPSSEDEASPSWLNRAWASFKALLWISTLASLATLPWIGAIFERLPVWSLLANILLVPLYALWVLPVALLGELCSVLGISSWVVWLFQGAGLGVGWGNRALLSIYDLPAGHVWVSAHSWVFVLLALTLMVAGVLLLRQQRQQALLVLLVGLSSYVGISVQSRAVGTASLMVWDVGQGASSALLLPDFSLVVDVPGKVGSKYNGGSTAAQQLRGQGVLKLDALALSHAQSDHAGGLSRLLANLNGVGEIWLADVPDNHHYPAFQPLIAQDQVRWLKQGDKFFISAGNQVQVLWPPQGYTPKNGNNASLVLLVTLKSGHVLLFPGDMEAEVESVIAKHMPAVDVMLMPHHGSLTSSSKNLVQHTSPRLVVAQTGFQNFYGFPKPEILRRYQAENSLIKNTAYGAVRIDFGAEKAMQIKQYQPNYMPKREQIREWLDNCALLLQGQFP